MKNKITQYDIYKGIRKGWDIDPSTKIRNSGKKYNRNKAKQEFRKEIDGF